MIGLINSHDFHITVDGHQPYNQDLYNTHCKDSYYRWDDHPQHRELIDPSAHQFLRFSVTGAVYGRDGSDLELPRIREHTGHIGQVISGYIKQKDMAFQNQPC